ncbi:MAG: type II secretion system F family protein [Epsilonproteobacteria bacterium]|nr:type II secretion system F family protein [Campylobacterota bacterium]
MKYFKATVLKQGKKEEVGFYAKDKKEALKLAKVKYHGIIIKVVEAEEPFEEKLQRIKEELTQNFQRKKIKPDALIGAIRQLAVMVNADMSITDSLSEIAESTEDPNLARVFGKVAEDINAGKSFGEALKAFRYEVGNLTIAMIMLGEKTGNLDQALYSLANMLEEIRANVIKFKKAMAYPRNVMIAMAIAFTILISYVVPQFKAIFEELGAQLPLPTIILLKLEYLFNNYGPYLLMAIFIGFMIFRYMLNTSEEFKYKWHQLLLKTYLIKNIIMYATLSRFTLVFSELINADVPVAEALDTAVDMIDSLPLKRKLQHVRLAVEKGNSLDKALEETGLFENMIIQMIRAAEQSGTISTMSKKVSEYYKMKFDAIIDGLSEAIEPIMLIMIAAMVILLALGIFLPMWDMGNAAQGRG